MEEMDKKVTGRKEIVAVLEEYPPPPPIAPESLGRSRAIHSSSIVSTGVNGSVDDFVCVLLHCSGHKSECYHLLDTVSLFGASAGVESCDAVQ